MAKIFQERQQYKANLGPVGADTRYVTPFDVPLMLVMWAPVMLFSANYYMIVVSGHGIFVFPSFAIRYHLSSSSKQQSEFCPGQIRSVNL